jgi:large subunit ribosomal protein L4
VLASLGLDGKKTLLVLAEADRNVFLSGRNMPNAQVTAANRLNTYDIVNAQTIVLAEGAVNQLSEQLA